MSEMRFLDTNVLLYAISRAPDEREKANRAWALIGEDDWALSVQVLQEFYVQATRPTKPDQLDHATATKLVESWLRFEIQEITVSILRSALTTSDRYQISYWDAAIIEAAKCAKCNEVYSEDLAEEDYGGVRIVNPFR